MSRHRSLDTGHWTLVTAPWLRHALALALYALSAAALTWPLAAHFTTHVPGDGIDDPALAWNLWWVPHRLVEQLRPDIFHVGWMFHPVDVNLAFYTLTPLNALLSYPLQAAFGLVTANNLIFLSAYVLGGYGVYLLARRLLAVTARPPAPVGAWLDAAAWVAGALYAFAAPKLFYAALGQFNIAASQWIPFCALCLARMVDARDARGAARAGALAGLFLVFQAWAELTYASFLLLLIGLLAVAVLGAWAARRKSGIWLRAQLAGFAALGVVFLLGISPYLAAMLPDLRAEGDFFAAGGGFAGDFSADLAGYLVPTRLHPFLGHFAAALPFANDKGQQVYVGYTALALALIGFVWLVRHASPRARAAGWFWGAGALFFWLLTLGPRLRWMGRDLGIPGPFALVSALPFFSGNRYPSRYAVMLLLAVALPAGAGLWALLAAARRRARFISLPAPLITGLVAALLLAEHLSTPLPLSDFRIPPVYATLAAAPGDFALLELPTGWRNGARVLGRSDTLIMAQQWWQTAHGKRRLGGNTSRNPAYKFQYFSEAPLLGDLIALMNADREHIRPVVAAQWDDLAARNRQIAPAVLAQLGVEYVTLHVDESPPELVHFVEEALPLALVEEGPGAGGTGAIRLYRVRPAPALPYAVDLALPAGNLHLAEGWAPLGDAAHGVRYATRPRADLLAAIPGTGARVRLDVAGPATAVTVSVGGAQVASAAVPAGGATLDFAVPAGLADAPVDRITLDFAGPGAPAGEIARASGPQGHPVGGTGAQLDPGVALLVRSAGEEVGDFAQVFVNGVNVAPGTRGYNLVALGADGSPLDAQAFDTLADEAESARLAEWVRGLPAGTVVAGAVGDEAGLRLTGEAVAALQSLGVAGDLRGKFRWSHAFVGAAGAPPGSALEDLALLRPASAFLGAPLDAPRVYGGAGALEIRE